MEFEKRRDGYGHLMKWIIGLGDLIVINLSFVLLYKLIQVLGLFAEPIDRSKLSVIFLLINLVYFVTSSIILPRLSSNIIFFERIIQGSISFISLYFILVTVGFVLLGIDVFNTGSWLFSYAGLVIIYIFWHIGTRIVLKWYRRKGYNYKRVVIVGDGASALNVYNEIKAGDYGYKVLGIFNNTNEIIHSDLPHLGNFSQVENFCMANGINEIYCTVSDNEENMILKLVNFAERNMIRFFLVPQFYNYLPRKLVLSFLQTIPVIGLMPEPLQLFYNRIIKRTFDILFSSVILLTVFPIIFLIFGSLVRLNSKGPVFFRQKRTGLQGKAFTCYKFRSMRINDDADTKTTSREDPRITAIGAFMRRTSLDELPQFFNVLTGKMSVVGPRPHMVKQTDLYNQLIDKFMIRHIVKPGITGWAQISGYRGETKTVEQMEERFKRDVWYIENWSFILDIKIIAVTVYQLLKGDNKAF